jgi:hypothetical protein
MFKQQLATIKRRFDAVMSQDIATFNKLLRDKNAGTVIKP